MQILGNTIVFAILYILFMIPTYILPYFGSNSPAAFAVGAAQDFLAPQTLLHAGALIVLMMITWFRGSLINKKWLIIFPILAAVFDLIPILSWTPLVPTVMHLFAVILGVASTTTTASIRESSI